MTPVLRPGRGRMIDIGGRRLRAVSAGPASPTPLVVLEAGSFGCAADWAVVQARLADKGLRSLAYDRAGLGHSDPGPKPRDAHAIAADLEALLRSLGETGPLVLAGHSMAGLFARVFVARNRRRVEGVVLVDAVTPEMSDLPAAAAAVHGYRAAARLVQAGSRVGLMRPVSRVLGDAIGLEGDAQAEKREVYGSAVHARWASEEVVQWPRSAVQGREAGPFAADLPVAVVSAGNAARAPRLRALQRAAAEASAHGHVRHVPTANHASLLGRRFADPIVEAVVQVLAARGG